MSVLLFSTSSYFHGIDPRNPSNLLRDYKRRPTQSTGPNDISPVTKQYIGGLDQFTFQIMNLKPVYGYGLHTLKVNGTTQNLKNGEQIKIGIVDSEGNPIQWSASPTRYGFDIQFFIDENKNSSGPGIFEMAGVKRDGNIISLIERFAIDTNPPPKPYGVSVKKRGFHTVDVGWFYATGYQGNKKPTHDRDLSGFHIWAFTSSLSDTTQVTSSAPMKTVPASDVHIPSLTTRSFATSIDGIDQDLIVADKTFYFYVSSFDDLGNENLKSLQSANLVFGSPGIPTASNPNVWIPIPEKNIVQKDWSSFSEISATQSAEITSSRADGGYANAPVYTTGVFHRRGISSTVDSQWWHNVLHTSSGEMSYKTMMVTTSIAPTGSKNFFRYVADDKPFTSDGSGALFLVVNNRDSAELATINANNEKFSNTARMFFVASGSQSFTAGNTGAFNKSNFDSGFGYPFPMLPLKPSTDYIISFRVKATSSVTGSEGTILPPLKFALTGSTFARRFSMSRDDDTGGFSVAPLTFSIPSGGPGVDSLLDLTTTVDPSNDSLKAFDTDLRYVVGDSPKRVQIKFNTGPLEEKHDVHVIDELGGTPRTIGQSSAAPDFDMALPFFFTETPGSRATGSAMGPLFGQGYFSTAGTLSLAGITHAGGGGIVNKDAQTITNTVGRKVFLTNTTDGTYAAGGGNSGSRFSGTWLDDRTIYIHNKSDPSPNADDIGFLGKGHFGTGSNFYSPTASFSDPQGTPLISRIGLTGSKEWMGLLTATPYFSVSQEQKNKQYPFLEERGCNTTHFNQYRFPDGTTNFLLGWPYITGPTGEKLFVNCSGTLIFSGSVLPSNQQLGIDMDKSIEARFVDRGHRAGYHHVLEFVNAGNIVSKAGRSVLLRYMEAGYSPDFPSAGATAPAMYHPLADSGSFYYFAPPSASLSRQTLSSPIHNDQGLNKIFCQDTTTPFAYRNKISLVGTPNELIIDDDDKRTFFVTGSGFLDRDGNSNVTAVYVHSDNPNILSLTPAPDAIMAFRKLSEINGSSNGFGVVGQNLGGEILSNDGNGALGNETSSILKIKIPPFKMINENNGSTVNTTLRFKIVNQGGFTGSIYNGTTFDISPTADAFKNDSRCGEYLYSEVPEANYAGSSLELYRTNNINIETPLTISYSYNRSTGRGSS